MLTHGNPVAVAALAALPATAPAIVSAVGCPFTDEELE